MAYTTSRRRNRQDVDTLQSSDADVTPLADDAATPREEVVISDAVIDDLAEEFKTELESQLAARQSMEHDWEKWQRAYLAKPSVVQKDYPYTGASNIVVPLIGEDVERMQAKVMQTIFGVEPLWTVEQRNKQYAVAAPPTQRFLDAIRSDVFDEFSVVEQAVSECLKLGTSGIFNDWVDVTTYRWDDIRNATVPAGRVLGPAPRWKCLEDILVPQGYADHQTSPWLGVREWHSLTRLRELEHAQAIVDVDRVVDAPDTESMLRQARRSGTFSRSESVTPVVEKLAAGTYAPWTVFFRRDLDGDGYPEEYSMLLHLGTCTVLRFKPNPYPSAMRPLTVLRYVAVEGEFYGIGIPQMMEHAQAEVSTIHNERRDNAHLCNIKMYVSSTTSNLTDTIRPASGKNIKVLDPSKDLKELRLADARQVDIYEEQVVTDQAHRRIGASELARGNVTSPLGRAAATTVMGAMQEGAQLFDFTINRIRRAIADQAMQIIELYQTHGLPEPDEPGSPEQFLDPEEATIVRQLLLLPDNLRGIVKVKVTASTSVVNREMEKQNLVQLYGIVTNYMQQMTQLGMQIGNPMLPPELKLTLARGALGLDDTMKLIFQAFNKFDLEAVLVGDIIKQLTVASLQQQAMMAQNPMIGAGAIAPTSGGDQPAQVQPGQQAPTGAPGSGPAVPPFEPPTNGGGPTMQ